MADPILKPDTIKIRELIENYRSGRSVIPEFQREYVWKRSKAPRLVDSLYRGFPISSLLLWHSDEAPRARRRDPRPTRRGTIEWLIDGQQRVITLSRVAVGDEGIDVVFNPETEEFSLVNAANRKDQSWVRVSELLEDGSYRRLRRSLDGTRSADKREQRFERVRRVLDYEVPVVRMINHTFDDAVLAFRRINTLGVRLKKEDIESAQIAARHSGFIADEVSPFLLRLRQQGFSRLAVMHLFRACAFIARPDGRNRTPLHELERREVLSAWKDTERATNQAIALIRSELGLVNMEVLWSGSLMVPVIILCATGAPRERDARGLIGWLALAALLHRYSGSSETSLDQDLRACRSQDPVRALLANLRQHRPSLAAQPRDFAGSLSDRSALLAAYIACLHRGIRDFFTGGKVVLQPSVDRHHILPRGQFAAKTRATADTVANIAFIAGDVNRAINVSGPEVYLSKIPKRFLESQCVPTTRGLWNIDRAEEFWRERRQLLADSFNEFLRQSLPQRRLA